MVSPEILCFTGSLDCLPKHEKENVCSFLEKKGVRPVFLTEKNPIDIGSVIPLKEDLSISPNLW